jgi:hypothetical protein
MPIMMGFALQRKRLLEAELKRISEELRPLGVLRMYLTGDLAADNVGPDTGLEFVLVQETDEAFHRRADFFFSHVRPRTAAAFFVYTPQEFEKLKQSDLILRRALTDGELSFG